VTATLANGLNQVEKPEGKSSPMMSKFIWAVLALAIVAGVAFRCIALDRKLIWADETVTYFFISGHSNDELMQLEGKAVTAEQLMQFQRLDSKKTAADALKQLSERQAEQGPVYYMLARSWAVKFGDGLASVRSFSAVIGVLIIAAVFWLCLELFGSTLAATVACALIALSPLALLYSQVARPYSLWSLEAILTGVFLLQGLRHGGVWRWVLYAAVTCLALYTQVLHQSVVVAQVVYVVLQSRLRISKRIMAFAGAILVAELLYWPWFTLIETGHNEASTWTENNIGAAKIGEGVAAEIGRTVLMASGHDPTGQMIQTGISIVCIGLAIFSFIFIVGTKLGHRARYLLCVALVPLAIVVFRDIQFGHFASVIDRYVIVSLLTVQMCVGFLIGSTLQSRKGNVRKGALAVMLTLLVAQAGSCVWFLNQNEFRFFGIGNGRIRVDKVGGDGEPIRITASKMQIMTLAHFMDSDAQLIFTFGGPSPLVKNYLLLSPNEEVTHRYPTYTATALGRKGDLWLLTRRQRKMASQ